jgi:hypothetical protein
MYTPSTYEGGSSVSHVDENTFANSGTDAVMTPNLEAGEVFNEPGPILLAMMKDLRNKPAPGLAVGVPSEVLNAQALIADSAAILTFTAPVNSRTTQVSQYIIKNVNTGKEIRVSDSPAVVTGLKNGTSYTFEIVASNSKGESPAVITKPVTPRAAWTSQVLDATSDARSIKTITFNGQPVVAYVDSKTSILRLATWGGKSWKKTTVDSDIAGQVSLCVSGKSLKQTLHIFYADKTDNDLRYATVNGAKISREIVDGNAEKVQSYEEIVRVPTASNVSVSNACAVTSDGIQVFYRDETQGVLLGAYKNFDGDWNYELVDGDRKTDGRSTGDVGFHLQATFDGSKTYVLYDSVISVNQKKDISAGAVRLATRIGNDPTAWMYQTLDVSTDEASVFGYDVALSKVKGDVMAAWLATSMASFPKPDQIRWALLSAPLAISKMTTENFGSPGAYLSIDGKTIVFNCQDRLCALDTSKSDAGQSAIRLVRSSQGDEPTQSAWVMVNKVKYLLATVGSRLALLKP